METGKNVRAQIFSDGVADSDSQQEKSKKSKSHQCVSSPHGEEEQ